MSRMWNFSREASSTGSNSPGEVSRKQIRSSLPSSEDDEATEVTGDVDEPLYNEPDDEDEDEDDDDDDEDEEDLQPASQYISALDLAGFG